MSRFTSLPNLWRSHPNPAVGQAQIDVNVPEAGSVRLVVYDLPGRELSVVSKSVVLAGTHRFVVDSSQFTIGMYFVAVHAAGMSETATLVVVK